ncbi:MAG: hypothetical protein OEV61_00470 [Chloroflexota bacterium]|jgi:hypothetical protein|nr:hypothetical protein [Chloroflexota bacterium]
MPFGPVGEWATEHRFRRMVMSDKSLRSLKALVEAEVPARV